MNVTIEILLWVMVSIIFLSGLAGSIFPGMPGPPIVFAGALIYGILTGFAEIGWVMLLALGLLAAISQLLDYLASAYGAKKFGGSSWGIWGSLIGGLIGFFIFTIPGMIIGLFSGAVIMELWKGKKETRAALKVGGGSLLGFLGGTLMKVIFSLLMIGLFLVDVWR
ncbi:MAG: DUF456 domain-containing protein [Candidatus Auribacterota bacterium]|nr:DUF456 domain-containing protein [Candidatus Auribacterota bacterium]